MENNKNLYEILNNKKLNIDYLSKIIFLITLAFILFINLKYSNNPILDQFGFRQTQTAITSYYLEKDGFRLNYETPVIGEAWSVPFEFPIYQEIVALTTHISGAPLIKVGRICGLIFTLLTCVPIFLILKRFHISTRAIYFSLALFLSSPIYILVWKLHD